MSQLNVDLIKNKAGNGGPTLEELIVTNESTLSGVRFTAGQLCESVNVVAGTLGSASDIDLSGGMIHYFTTQEPLAAVPNLMVAGKSVDSIMAIGESISVVIILTSSASGYISSITIDGAPVSPLWSNANTPSEGGASGVDVYTFQIIKTAASTYTVLANSSNFA